MQNRTRPLAALAFLAAASLAACSSASTSASSSPPAFASAPASPLSASAPPSAPATPAGDPPSASAASAKACAELDAWQKEHGNSVAPPQEVFDDLIDTPQPLSVDFTTWDFAVETNLPDAEADLLKVWTDCAKAEAAAMGG